MQGNNRYFRRLQATTKIREIGQTNDHMMISVCRHIINQIYQAILQTTDIESEYDMRYQERRTDRSQPIGGLSGRPCHQPICRPSWTEASLLTSLWTDILQSGHRAYASTASQLWQANTLWRPATAILVPFFGVFEEPQNLPRSIRCALPATNRLSHLERHPHPARPPRWQRPVYPSPSIRESYSAYPAQWTAALSSTPTSARKAAHQPRSR